MRRFIVFVCLLVVTLNLSLLSIAGDSDVTEQLQQTSHQQELKMSTWQQVSCLSQVAVAVLTFGLIISVCIQFHIQLREDSKYRMYDYLASLYYRIFEIGIEHPALIDENRTKHYQSSFTGNQAARYDAYTHMVWAHAEDIFDKAKKYKRLEEIYKPTLKRYCKLHGTWYENNKPDFPMEGFEEFVKKYCP